VDCDFPVEAGTTENTSAEEMIMSVTLTARVAPEARAARSRTCGLAVSRWWAAYINWRIEHAAIPQLCAMSDRKLKDIGPHPLSHSAKGESRSGVRGKIAGAAAERAGKHTVMKSNMMSPVHPANRGRVIALHCSGGGAGQWKKLGEVLGPTYQVTAPEHYGCEQTGAWIGTHAFTLADEAARTIDIIDQSDGKVHLVGHSYGGGVALHVALARLDCIASLSLYEPSAFHLLKAMGDQAAAAFAEIVDITRRTGHGVISGDYAGAAAGFVDYWSGRGAWASLKPSVQAALARWVVKAPLDFRALIEEPTPLTAYAGLRMPVLVMRGEHAPRPTRKIAEALPGMFPRADLAVVDGAGHMGPLTHGTVVSELIAAHIRTADTATRRASGCPTRVATKPDVSQALSEAVFVIDPPIVSPRLR